MAPTDERSNERPLARERAIALPLLDRFIESSPGEGLADVAAGLRRDLTRTETPGAEQAEPLLSPKEMEVLLRLEYRSDKDIAQELNLTYHGVRYRVRHIFAKLGARGRLDAVHRARAMGLLPGEGAEGQVHR